MALKLPHHFATVLPLIALRCF